jgi:hypothetical protein
MTANIFPPAETVVKIAQTTLARSLPPKSYHRFRKVVLLGARLRYRLPARHTGHYLRHILVWPKPTAIRTHSRVHQREKGFTHKEQIYCKVQKAHESNTRDEATSKDTILGYLAGYKGCILPPLETEQNE